MKNYIGTALLVTITCLSLSLNSCYYDNAEDLYPEDTTAIIDTNIVYTYTGHAKAIIDGNCATAGCHVSGTGRQPFTSYAEVSAAIQNFNLKGRIEGTSGAIMPPSGSLPQSQLAILTTWINNNYPEN